ncbi:GNAT family N-acetyltransferase [Haloactinopolyspora alba]|uniref:GNAT family N-acetyltransferase n=1 Tax=Haloactinopolyspora alba TaxID=648780 RepID=UPI000D0E2665
MRNCSGAVHWTGQRQVYVGLVAVTEQEEGRGIGRALVERLKAWSRDRGAHRIMLDTGVANHRARSFYARLGFEEESVRLSSSV